VINFDPKPQGIKLIHEGVKCLPSVSWLQLRGKEVAGFSSTGHWIPHFERYHAHRSSFNRISLRRI